MPDKRENKIFIDADAFVALIDKKDPNHKRAQKFNDHIEEANYIVFTSNFAAGESITVISQNAGHSLAVAFGKKLFTEEILVIDVKRQQELKALVKFAQQKSKNVRFTDFVNMVLMDELKIKTIFSFDKHYKKAGYLRLGIEEKI